MAGKQRLFRGNYTDESVDDVGVLEPRSSMEDAGYLGGLGRRDDCYRVDLGFGEEEEHDPTC